MAAQRTVSILGHSGKLAFPLLAALSDQDHTTYLPLPDLIEQVHNKPIVLPLLPGNGIRSSHQGENKKAGADMMGQCHQPLNKKPNYKRVTTQSQ
jgi:hypothetical protein